MRNCIRCLSAMIVCIFSAAVYAAPPASAPKSALNYTNVDVGVWSTELNGSSLSGQGLMVRGSMAVHPNVFLAAELSDIGYSHNVDGFLWGIGAGGHMPVTNTLDVVGKLEFLHQNVDGRDGENGYSLHVTVRGFVVDRLEVEGGIRQAHFKDSGNDTSVTGEGRYFFTNRIAGGVLLQLGDTNSFGVVGRFTF